MGFNTASVWLKVSVVCLALATLVFVIGFATVSWMSYGGAYGSSDYGLWRHSGCDRSRCWSYKISGYWLDVQGWEDWYQATRAFECVGLICLGLALLITFLFVFVDRCKKRSALIATIVFTFAAVLAMVIGFLIFALKFDDVHAAYGVGWSMGLAIAGAILAFIAGVFLVIELKK
ncbi:uncharacterized protein LOC128208757 [Mya arenaria]|uniref:uncharacterized protein LOC128208757 n=1 Tax=Mya arenaria TaxID=6604 RepID=UPI0022E4E075|nr:uncharacterized protein LOC128208757 [Mya arenaria]